MHEAISMSVYVQLSKGPQPARVQRHSGAVLEAGSAPVSAAAALHARLSPSSAQLASSDQSQNVNPNPWGPPAHALGTHPLQARQAMAVHTSHSQPAPQAFAFPQSSLRDAAHQPLANPQQHEQQSTVHNDNALPGRSGPQTGSVLAATQAWFLNPAFGSESPMPSPEKQPRSQPPPRPHPSTFTGAEPPLGCQQVGQGLQQAGLSATANWSQSSPTQHHFARASGYEQAHASESRSQADRQAAPAHALASPHQRPGPDRPERSTHSHDPFGGRAESGWSSEYQQQPAQASSHAMQSPQHSLHQRHGFPSLPARQQHPQQAACSVPAEQHVLDSAQHRQPQGLPSSLAQPPSQHAQHVHCNSAHAVAATSRQIEQSQQQSLPDQHQQQLQQQERQPLSFSPDQAHLQGGGQGARSEAVLADERMSGYVRQLQERLAAAEEQAAHARSAGEHQAQTLEARITVLEGRVRFVEGGWLLHLSFYCCYAYACTSPSTSGFLRVLEWWCSMDDAHIRSMPIIHPALDHVK